MRSFNISRSPWKLGKHMLQFVDISVWFFPRWVDPKEPCYFQRDQHSYFSPFMLLGDIKILNVVDPVPS